MLFRSTENDHVKSTIPARLRRMRTFGVLPLSAFKDLITKQEFVHCERMKPKSNTWYSLTIDVFISFLFKVTIIIYEKCTLN